MPALRWTVLMLAGPAALVACGQFGPLYLPDKAPPPPPSPQRLLLAPTSASSAHRPVAASSGVAPVRPAAGSSR